MGFLHLLGTDIYSMPKLVFCSTPGTLVSFLFAKSRRTFYRDITTPFQYIQNSWQSIQNISASVWHCTKSNQNLIPNFHCCTQWPSWVLNPYGTGHLNLSVMGIFRHQNFRSRQSQRMQHNLITVCHHLVYSFIYVKTKPVWLCNVIVQFKTGNLQMLR